jgi:kynureninase
MNRASITRTDCEALDRQDPLAALRAQFSLPDGVIYLDGNSLGPLPLATPGRLATTLNDEWGKGLITSWNTAGWLSLPQQVGDKIARLIGAHPGEVVAATPLTPPK